jgi:rubrerythrin
MKLEKDVKIAIGASISIFIMVALALVFYYYHGMFGEFQSLIITILGELTVLAIAYWILRQSMLDVRKLAQAQDEAQKEKERREKIQNHYDGLRENVFEKWLSLSVKVEDSLLKSWSDIEVDDNWHKWAIQHLCDTKGYPEISELFDKLKSYEKTHNDFVSSLWNALIDEAKTMLRSFSNLRPYEEGIDDFYIWESVKYALLHPKIGLRIFYDKELYYGGGAGRIAKSNKETIPKLKKKLERIEKRHQKDYEKIEETIKKEEEILDQIRNKVKDIVDILSEDKPLRGKCDYCKELLLT